MVKTRLSTFEDVHEHLQHLEKEFERSCDLFSPPPGGDVGYRYMEEKARLNLVRDLLTMMEN